MRIARVSHQEAITYGIVDEGELVVLKGDPMFVGFDTTGERIPLAEVTLLAPVIPRSKIVAIARNYRDHAAELGNEVPAEPMLFFKPNTSVVGPNDHIVLPRQSERIDFEGEVAAVIGRVAKNVPRESALDYVFGYTIANDVTARDLQKSDGQWARAKGFDTSCPLGPAIETEFDPSAEVWIETRVNGEVKQRGLLGDMVYDVAEIVAYASAAFTLLPGDVILTGTPAGVGPFVAGDVVEVEVTGLGILRNTARDA
ncbi:fumarylacetoacetate hydrolase family protein [Microbacterium sp. RU33B]|uniref:fumarylacetoacetate hydrolase family protein n=1 Tax=Microbacterium sp. RU33B TaxID=1907390 RepID=UPI0009642BB1|nr:fumarylacetoacetate hydrolase family protein [Microbacterium sp. RU33B]SIT72814.1 2-keto-4-pentenoate hydratase/2-oxohepta-3-ene-1,7-dioic acid hydratase (catechol pathway) [Microbacterium sp. RU33B]